MDEKDWELVLKSLRTAGVVTKKRARELQQIVDDFWAAHWRDDDSPISETTFGVC